MKAGFYLRPDGEEIIEIVDCLSQLALITDFSIMFESDIVIDIRATYGNWIYLGV